MSPTYHAIAKADLERNEEELQRIFKSITTEQLNEHVDIDPGNILLQRIIHTFDSGRRYQYLVIGLFDSSNVDTSRLDINHQHAQNGLTPLMVAAYRGNFEVLKKLISLGADMQLVGTFNRTAFRYACWKGNMNAIGLLLPFVELREYTLRGREGETIIEDVQKSFEVTHRQPLLDVMKLLAISHEKKLEEVLSTNGRQIPTKNSKSLHFP